ncbi:MAG TPA: type VI secretion system ATPase TssH [Planctomycetota bacterium]|nr:type VI secretion system ATPase TssH [Planctomycetota bacterium]
MAQVNLSALVGRLDDTCRRALEAAAGLCLSRTHYNVEIEHWLFKLLETPGNDVGRMLERFEIDAASLQKDLTRALDRFKTGNSRPPAIAPNVVDLAREAWLVASLDHGATVARSGHLLIALLADETLARQAYEISRQFEKLPEASLRKDFAALTANSSENAEVSSKTADPAAGGTGAAPAARGGGALDQFTVDLTARAKGGHIDPVLGRDSEIRQVIDILLRRRQNNPILTGEPGVGKTAVAEGFALKIAQGDVPQALAGVRVLSLDLQLLQAGAGVKGEFENRLKNVIQEVKASQKPIILFIDEAHQMVGAGGSAGQGDAANLLKPALARGELRTIAATTWAEYKKYFERDAALARRFQVVKIEEPDEETAVEIMRGLTETMERHHKVRVLDEAVIDSVRLSKRYLSGRQLPDKSVSLLDTACARVALSQASTPAALEDCVRRKRQLDTTLSMLQREEAASGTQGERIAKVTQEKTAAEAEHKSLLARWEEEKTLTARVRELRSKLESPFTKPADGKPAPVLTDAEKKSLRAELDAGTKKLRALQGDVPLIQPFVDAQAVAEVLANWTGIPVGRMVADQVKSVLTLKEQMCGRVVGQDHALGALAEAIRTSRAGLTDPVKPIGVFMLVGTSGVGKTETAITLAELLYGGEQNMTTINMSEFKEEHKVSLLMGSPPGYVGYGEGGVLTEAVRRKPYSVVLLDELEKAHSGVQDIFYQVFDKGRMKDGEGRDIDFRNTVILMTTNAGTDTIMSLWADQSTMPDAQGLGEALKPELLKFFKPAFLGRCTVLPYFPLSESVMKSIIALKLRKVAKRVLEAYGAKLEFTPALVDAIGARCTEVETGARNADLIISRTLLPELASRFLERMSEGQPIRKVEVGVGADSSFSYVVSGE